MSFVSCFILQLEWKVKFCFHMSYIAHTFVHSFTTCCDHSKCMEYACMRKRMCVCANNANALIWSKMKTESERQKGLKSSSWYSTNNFKMPFSLRTSFWCVIGKKWVGLKHIVIREKELRKIELKTDVMNFYSHHYFNFGSKCM